MCKIRAIKASIFVLTYNHGPYIRDCLESLVAQETDFPFEILVGEDGSTDETRAIVEEFAERYPELIRAYCRPHNLGTKENSRLLRQEIRGLYVAYCEGDDYWHRPDKLQIQVKILEGNPDVTLVCSDVDVLVHETGKRYPSVMKRIGQWQKWPEDVARGILTREINISTCSVCLRHETLMKMWRENPYEFGSNHGMGDIQMFIEASLLGRVYRIQESLATYRAISESATQSKNPEKVFNFLLSSIELFEHYVRTLQYGDNVMNQVRITHFVSLAHLAVRFRSEGLRKKINKLAQEKNVHGERLSQRLALWALRSRVQLQIGSIILPWARLATKTIDRTSTFLSFFSR